MPRSLQYILDHADELARQAEEFEPEPGQMRDATPLRAVRDAVLHRAEAENEIADAVAAAREAGLSWQSIALYLGTSGEAARQRYGQKVSH